jgi:hypothetical protein
MSWAKLDDAMLDNHKVAAVGGAGFALHIAGILYCARNLTDGFIPAGKVATLVDSADFRPSVAALLARLVTNNLWHRNEERNGYDVHDYLTYNPTKEKVLADRESARNRQGRHRRSLTELQARSQRSHAVTEPESPRDFARTSDAPVPVPVPSSEASCEASSGARALNISTWGHSPFPVEIPPLPADLTELLTAEVREHATANGCRDVLKCLKHWHQSRWSKRGDRRLFRTDHLADFMAWLCSHERFGGSCQKATPPPTRREQPQGADRAIPSTAETKRLIDQITGGKPVLKALA